MRQYKVAYFVDVVDENTRKKFKDKNFHCIHESTDLCEALEYAVGIIKKKSVEDCRLWKVRVMDLDRKFLQVTNSD